jgi:hypothetical protein
MNIFQKIIVLLLSYFVLFTSVQCIPVMAETNTNAELSSKLWPVQSIDTMKFSRDTAREKENDIEFDAEIEKQVTNISATGATHVAIGTPYDEEFIPYMKRWITIARSHGLHIWFKGNFSGWEGWFDYPKITREEHTTAIKEFILKNPDLFEDGDLFTSCPECENGGPGDPRMTGDIQGHRDFLTHEYAVVKDSFAQIHKNVNANYYSMNGDVARVVMDKKTTKALDGVVTIDHYVKTVDQLIADIHEYENVSGGQVILGEWGAPIPDIHGDMTEDQQAEWIDNALHRLMTETEIVGLNYWTNKGSSTSLWNDDNSAKKAVETITKYYNTYIVIGVIKNTRGEILSNATVISDNSTYEIHNGIFTVPLFDANSITIRKDGYKDVIFKPTNTNKVFLRTIVLQKKSNSFFEKFMDYIISILKGKNF